jgi:hypothetical protein
VISAILGQLVSSTPAHLIADLMVFVTMVFALVVQVSLVLLVNGLIVFLPKPNFAVVINLSDVTMGDVLNHKVNVR